MTKIINELNLGRGYLKLAILLFLSSSVLLFSGCSGRGIAGTPMNSHVKGDSHYVRCVRDGQ